MHTIPRSEINLAPYNPRIMTTENGRALKRNIRAVGLLAPLVWNERTGNLVSGHQRLERLDQLEGYPKRKAEYLLSVALVDLDHKTEKEQNLFFNNLSAQGDWDLDSLADLLSEVDYKAAGFTDRDMAVLDIDTDAFGFSDQEEETEADAELQDVQNAITGDQEESKGSSDAETLRKADVRERRRKMKKDWDAEGDVDYSLTVVFRSAEEKQQFMERIKIDKSVDIIRSDRLLSILQDDSERGEKKRTV